VFDKNKQVVCIREIQKSLTFSAKKLLEDKIKNLGVSHLFDITLNEIRRVNGDGIIIFQGMQNHTADSIKSLEGFDIAWVEEAQKLSTKSLELLLPTIRSPGSQLWFSWNPDQDDDPIDLLFSENANDDDFVCVHVNFDNNPFCPEESKKEAARALRNNPKTYGHIWLGGYKDISDSVIFSEKFTSVNFEPENEWEPLHGLDWGFANDPTAAIVCYVVGDNLYIYKEGGKIGLELDDTVEFLENKIPGISKYVIRADCARPESISHVKRKGFSKIIACKKWPGSVEDGIEFMRNFKMIYIHPNCPKTFEEFRKYSYKVHKQTDDILPDIVDKHNHYIDACRYALGPLIKGKYKYTRGAVF